MSCELQPQLPEGPCSWFLLQEWARVSTISHLFLCCLTRGWLLVCRFLFGLCFLYILTTNQTRIWPHYSIYRVIYIVLLFYELMEHHILAYFCEVMSRSAMRVLTGVSQVWGGGGLDCKGERSCLWLFVLTPLP